MRSAGVAWVVLVGWVITWDTIAPRFGFETMTATWRRWRAMDGMRRAGLDTALGWLGRHLF